VGWKLGGVETWRGGRQKVLRAIESISRPFAFTTCLTEYKIW